jgi:hypothetical protein
VLALGAVRSAATGKAIPDTFERLYQFEALSEVYHPTIEWHLAAYRALPRERALALCDKRFAEDWSYGPAAVILAAHPDGTRRARLLEAFTPELRRAILLRAATEEAQPTRVLTSRHVLAEDKPLVTAIVDEVVRREGSRATCDQHVVAYGALRDVFVDALCKAIGEHGADAAFFELLRGSLSYVDHQRVLGAVKGGVESAHDLLLRMAESSTGPKQRIHLLDRDGSYGFTAREGSFSRVGGSVPGLSKSDYPVHGGEPMTPILSFDLDEVPELAKHHPGARLLVLFHPAPEIADLQKQVAQRGGHVGGGPFWIQDADSGSEGFLFELRGGLCALNLGDFGSFYAFDGPSFYFQCH